MLKKRKMERRFIVILYRVDCLVQDGLTPLKAACQNYRKQSHLNVSGLANSIPKKILTNIDDQPSYKCRIHPLVVVPNKTKHKIGK